MKKSFLKSGILLNIQKYAVYEQLCLNKTEIPAAGVVLSIH